MKKLSILIPVLFCFMAPLFFVSSCAKMDDIQRKFTSRAEIIYLGKVDSIQSFPGVKRAKLTWYLSADPRIDQTIIYWNMRRDSIVFDVNRDTSGLLRDSVIIDSLPEGNSLFEFRNVNKEGETSLYSSATVTVWGPQFADGLNGRIMQGFNFDYGQSTYTLSLSPVSENDNLLYSQIEYTNSHGEEKKLRIDRDSVNVKLDNFPNGDSLRFRNVFSLPQAIDTLYSEYKVFKSPSAVSDRGDKISLIGDMGNQYFSRGNNRLYEWNTDGDLNVYVVKDSSGALVKTESLQSAVPRSDFKFFFFYDADIFIGITTESYVVLKKIINNILIPVKTPAGDDFLGRGFGFIKYIPARGFFYSLTAGTGDLKTWFAKDNATWASGNGSTVGTGFTDYNILALFNYQTLLAVDPAGHLLSMPISANGKIGSKSRIGSGWNRFKKIISVGTKLYCMEENGDFYVFDDFDPNGSKYWIVN